MRVFGEPFAIFRITCRTPFLKLALAFSSMTSAGSQTIRRMEPDTRSRTKVSFCLLLLLLLPLAGYLKSPRVRETERHGLLLNSREIGCSNHLVLMSDIDPELPADIRDHMVADTSEKLELVAGRALLRTGDPAPPASPPSRATSIRMDSVSKPWHCLRFLHPRVK